MVQSCRPFLDDIEWVFEVFLGMAPESHWYDVILMLAFQLGQHAGVQERSLSQSRFAVQHGHFFDGDKGRKLCDVFIPPEKQR